MIFLFIFLKGILCVLIRIASYVVRLLFAYTFGAPTGFLETLKTLSSNTLPYAMI